MKKLLLKKKVSYMMLIILVLSSLLSISISGSSGFNVEYKEIGSHKNTFIGKITINNTGTKELYNWKIEFDFDGSIRSLCNASIVSNDQGHYVLEGQKKNNIIYPKKSLVVLIKGSKKADTSLRNIIVSDLNDEIAKKAAAWNSYVENTEAQLMNKSIAEFLYYRYTRFEADMLYAQGYEHIVKNPVREFTNARYQNVEFETENNLKLKGLFFPVKKPKGTLIALHGRGDDMYNTIQHIEFLLENGYQVLLFNSRFWNYYENPETYYGTMNEDVNDVGSAVEYLKTRRDVDKNKIGVIGFSNGANKAILAGRHFDGIKTVICSAPSAFPFFDDDEEISPPGWLYIRDEWMNIFCERYGCEIEDFRKSDGLTCLSETKKPVLLLHGANDPYVKSVEIERLFQAANGPKEMYIFKNSGHCNQVFTEDKNEYITRVITFLNKYMTK